MAPGNAIQATVDGINKRHRAERFTKLLYALDRAKNYAEYYRFTYYVIERFEPDGPRFYCVLDLNTSRKHQLIVAVHPDGSCSP